MKSYSGGVRHDYKDSDLPPSEHPLSAISLNRRGLHWFAIGLVLPLIAVMLMLVSEPNESMVTTGTAVDTNDSAIAPGVAPAPGTAVIASPMTTTSSLNALALMPPPGERIRLALPPRNDSAGTSGRLSGPEQAVRDALLATGDLVTLTVRSGDSLDLMFRRNNLSISDLAEMVALPEGGGNLAKINPGDKIEIIHEGERVLALSRDLSEAQQLWIKRDGEGFAAELIDLEIEYRTAGAHGVIESSLYEAAYEAGLSDAVIDQIWRNIFEWHIDFWLDIRSGDSFTVVYEEKWRDGVKLGDGRILAAEFINQGKTYRAARYLDAAGDAGYYQPDGMSMQRPFLMNPVEFTRISSGFNPNRRHPISNTIRAHRGVDLAAPTGTPVRAAGDGKIIALGEYGSYGNRVEIQHGGGITTLYAHLSRFGRFRVGDRVGQSEVIGFVGATGGATGPHLHYEYRISGVHQNPRTVELPDAEPIAREYLADFQASTSGLWRQLDLYQSTLLAHNGD